MPKSKWLTSLGYGLGIASLMIGGVACYQYSYANNLAEEGNKIAKKQNVEFAVKMI